MYAEGPLASIASGQDFVYFITDKDLVNAVTIYWQ